MVPILTMQLHRMSYFGLSNKVIHYNIKINANLSNKILNSYRLWGKIDDENIIDQLIKNGANINVTDEDGKTLLHITSSTGKN